MTLWEQGKVVDVLRKKAAASPVGRPAPELDGIEWLNTDGNAMTLASYRGKYVLLDFWTTWCGPCHAQFPSVSLVHELYGEHVAVIGVHDNSVEPNLIREHVAKIGLSFPIVIDHPDGRITSALKAFGLGGYPSYMLIGPDGNVVQTDNQTPGPTLWNFKLEVIRSLLLKEKTSIKAD